MFQIPGLTNPVLLTLFYRVIDAYHAEISIKGSNEEPSVLSVIYDGLQGIKVYTIDGDEETEILHVQDCEVITIHLRRDSVVIGAAILEIDVSLAGTHGLIAAPIALLSVHLDQEDLNADHAQAEVKHSELVEGVQLL